MNALAGMTGSRLVTSSAGGEDDRGAAIQRRIEALGVGDREWHAMTGIARSTLHRAIRNDPGTKNSTYVAIEAYLDKLEARNAGRTVAIPAPSLPPEGMIEFDITGDFGVHVVVKGPVTDAAEVRRQAMEIFRDIRAKGDIED